MQKPDMTWEKITATNKTYTTATNKAVNTNGFILNQIRYYNTTATKATGAYVAANTFSAKAASVNLAYSTNCGAAPGWSVGDYIYLIGTIGTDGLFYLDATQWWSNALPSTNDGKLYIRIGVALTTTDSTASFLDDRPIFYHNGTKICEYKVADNKQDTLVSGTNIKTINNQSLLGTGDISITTDIDTLLATLYPVGAIYIGTQATCPLATLISGSTWTIVGTSIITDVSIPSTIAVYGNGKTLGYTDGTNNLALLPDGDGRIYGMGYGYDKNIGTDGSGENVTTNKYIGIVSDTSGKSGLVAKSNSITKTSITVNIWQRTA
jgi:hypothetical protein